jgi:hypothetical protein
MNLKKILLSSVAAVALTSVAALAADDGGVVRVAQDQTGDYLVFPAYYANTSGWSTNLKVVNTNTTHAVVAKVVIREHMSSAEKLDFPIYLTPGDVWEANLVNVGGTVYVQSTDDSMFNNGTPASDVNPVNQALFAAATNQDNTKGYVEVFGFASIDGGDVVNGWTQGNPLSKTALYTAFNTNLNGATAGVGDWVEVDNNSLYGQEVISAANSNGNLAMTLMATAFENVTGTGANDAVVVATESDIITNTTQASAAVIIDEIEDALQKSDVYVTYYDASSTAAAETALLLTQPMKKYRFADSGLTLSAIGYAPAGADLASPTLHTLTYTPLARNQTENSLISTTYYSGGSATTYTCNYEICQISVNSFVGSFTKGYVDFSLDQGAINSMPVIPAVMTAKSVGGTNVTNIIYPAYK